MSVERHEPQAAAPTYIAYKLAEATNHKPETVMATGWDEARMTDVFNRVSKESRRADRRQNIGGMMMAGAGISILLSAIGAAAIGASSGNDTATMAVIAHGLLQAAALGIGGMAVMGPIAMDPEEQPAAHRQIAQAAAARMSPA